MEIRFSNKKDIPKLKYIWNVCFGDDEKYIDIFFKRLYKPGKAVVACDENIPVGVVHLLDAFYKETPFYYGYAVGVLPQYRGQSICKKMLDFVKDYTNERGALFGLHPANNKLFSFYRSIGLSEMYSLKTVHIQTEQKNSGLEMSDISPEQYYEIRAKTFRNAVLLSREVIDYMITEVQNTGGFSKKIIVHGKEHLLMGRILDNVMYIKETTLSDDDLLSIAPELLYYFKQNKMVCMLPVYSQIEGEENVAILGFGEQNRDIYMNLFMD